MSPDGRTCRDPVSLAQAAWGQRRVWSSPVTFAVVSRIMRIVSPPFSALSHSWVLSGGLAVSPRKCLLSDAGASVPGICCRLSSPGAAWTDGLWPLRVVKCAVVAPLPVCSLPASPASLSCSGWGKAVRIPGRETQLRVT